MNDTKSQPNKQDQKNQRQKARQEHGRKKQGQNPNLHDGRKHLEEHENPEMRMTR